MGRISFLRLFTLLVVHYDSSSVFSTPTEEGSSVSSSLMGEIEVVQPSSRNHTGTVIMLHGSACSSSGGTGMIMKSCINTLRKNSSSFPHLKIMYPTAPLRPFTVLEGKMSNVWYDVQEISFDSPEQIDIINSMAEELVKLIESETKAGIPHHRIVIGGFSMGGSMAMHLAYRFLPQIGGVFALASYLNNNSITFKDLEEKKPEKLPSLFYAHGDKDNIVLLDWAQTTFEKFQSLGVKGVFHTIPNTYHELRIQQIDLLFDWISNLVPDE